MLKFFAEKMWVAFALQKLLIFSTKYQKLYIESAKTVNEMTLNELVKLTTLWTTGPWIFSKGYNLVENNTCYIWLQQKLKEQEQYFQRNHLSPYSVCNSSALLFNLTVLVQQ